MGGKKKPSSNQPRIKGNYKPSSSDKAARFLFQQIGSLEIPSLSISDPSSQVNFLERNQLDQQNVSGKLHGFVPILQDPDASGLDARILSILKKLEKRDAVTKQKSLRDFLELLKSQNKEKNSLNSDSVIAALPFWPRIYCRLSFDTDRKVRELVQSVMHSLALCVGKELCLHLKQIFPTWTYATIDTHEPAASLASQGLTDIFRGSKLSDANRLCARQLLDLVEDQLMELQSISCGPSNLQVSTLKKLDTLNPKSSIEDINTREEKSIRSCAPPVCAAAILRFLTSFIEDLATLPSDHKQMIRLKYLLSPDCMWKKVIDYLTSRRISTSSINNHPTNTSTVYSAMYKLCVVLCRNSSWNEWLMNEEDGRYLAQYVCLITVGSVGYNHEVHATIKIPENHLFSTCSSEVGSGFYSALWDAALACLTYLPSNFVWSVVDWKNSFVPRMEYLMSFSGKGQAKQLYTNLICLLNQFPLDFSNLSSDEEKILNLLFVDNSLVGLKRSLRLIATESLSSTGTVSYDDPGVSVIIVSGILECSRFLIDRLLNNDNSDNLSKYHILVNRIYEEIILKLIADCLNIYQISDRDSPRLVCNNPPLIRQSYQTTVFMQVSRLFNHLACSNNQFKINLYHRFRTLLIDWISTDSSDSFYEDQIHKITRLYVGRIDPLRFVKFLDCLARASSQKINPKKSPVDLDQVPVVQADWCVELFITISELIKNNIKLNENFSNVSHNKCFHILIILCLYGHLPLNYLNIPSIFELIFSVLLLKLTQEVHTVCWSNSIILGLAKLWIQIDEQTYNNFNLFYSLKIYHNFLTYILPKFLLLIPNIQKLTNSKLLFNRLNLLLCSWVDNWFEKSLSSFNITTTTITNNNIITTNVAATSISYNTTNTETNKDNNDNNTSICNAYELAESLINLHTLFSISLHNINLQNSHSVEIGIYSEVINKLCDKIINYKSDCLNYILSFGNGINHNNDENKLPKTIEEFYVLGNIIAYLTEASEFLHKIISKIIAHSEFPNDNSNLFKSVITKLDQIYLIVMKLLLIFKKFDYFIKTSQFHNQLTRKNYDTTNGTSSSMILMDNLNRINNELITNEENLLNHSNSLFSINELIEQFENIIFRRINTLCGYNFEQISDLKHFFYSIIGLLLKDVIYSNLNLTIYNFVEKLYSLIKSKKELLEIFNELWLELLVQHTNNVLESIITDFYPLPNSHLISRFLLPSNGCFEMKVLPQLGRLVRLYQLDRCLNIHVELSSKTDLYTSYLLCIGLLRTWLCNLNETCDLSIDLGCSTDLNFVQNDEDNVRNHNFEPSTSAFNKGFVFLVKHLGNLWYELTGNYSIEELLQIIDLSNIKSIINQNEAKNHLVQLTLNTLLFNRLRTIHPNLWPKKIKLAASCTDDPTSENQSWSDMCFNIACDANMGSNFRNYCEVYIPVGIVRRCLPRQELLGRLKSFTLLNNECTFEDLDNLEWNIRANIVELIASLVNVRVAAPIFLTTFSSILLEDYRTWLTNMADALNEKENLCRNSSQIFRTSISAMSFFECLLMLWQPWQWSSFNSDKSSILTKLGLVQLSMRMRHLRPQLTSDKWDFILCLAVSWISTSANCLFDSKKDKSENTLHSLFAYHSFRLAAALGAVFIKRHPNISQSSDVLMKNSTNSKLIVSSGTIDENGDIEVEDEEPINEFENEENYTDELDANATDDQMSSDLIASEAFILSEDNDEDEVHVNVELVENEDDVDDEEYFYNALSKGLPLIPQRGHAPLPVQIDWENFFAKHLYSMLLPLVLKHCIPSEYCESHPSIDSEMHIRSLCAAFALCPANHLVTILTEQPGLVLEFLVNLQVSKIPSFLLNQIIKSQNSTIYDFTSSFRASLDLAYRLIANSPVQCGQLLGHILLNRLFVTQTYLHDQKSKVSIANYLIRRIPVGWLSSLYGLLPQQLENYILSEQALDNWGRGSLSLFYLTTSDSELGWQLNCVVHQALLAYLLAWDSLLSLMSCVGPQSRARLQNSLLGQSSVFFDRLMLIIGLLLPSPGNLDECMNVPCRLEPDDRLLLPTSSSHMCLAAALSACSGKRFNRRSINLINSLVSGDDREWRDVFTPDDTLLSLPGHRTAYDINHFAVRLFRRLLAEAPALVRAWHSQLTSLSSTQEEKSEQLSPLAAQKPGRLRQLAAVIDKMVSRHFSSSLAHDEVVLVQYRSYLRLLKKERDSSRSLFSILRSPAEDGSVRIKGRPLSREVIATYHVGDEHSMEMSIQLPINYPLSPVMVVKNRGIGVSVHQWQSWILQLSVFINNHNGSILDGIDLWQRNVRKKFEGVEECAICYSIVHNTNFSLPKMQCHTCRKLFHYACMYKWFTTSRNPACPLCRHLFFDPTGRTTCAN